MLWESASGETSVWRWWSRRPLRGVLFQGVMEEEEKFASHSGRSQMSRKAVQGRELISDQLNNATLPGVGT